MGRTVINETENKQTVILNDSPESVEGGYFDSQMNWHELGGNSGFEYSFNHITKGGLSDATNVSYFDTGANTRCGEKYFITVLPGNYVIDIESSEAVEYAVNYYTTNALDKVMLHSEMTLNTNSFSLGWKSTDVTEFTLPEAAFAIRIAFRHPDNSAFERMPITKCVIKKV